MESPSAAVSITSCNWKLLFNGGRDIKSRWDLGKGDCNHRDDCLMQVSFTLITGNDFREFPLVIDHP